MALNLEKRTFGGVDRTWDGKEYNLMLAEAMKTDHRDYLAMLALARYAGLRHTYAHEQYDKFIKEGCTDFAARKKVLDLLGHHRDDVTRIYLSDGDEV